MKVFTIIHNSPKILLGICEEESKVKVQKDSKTVFFLFFVMILTQEQVIPKRYKLCSAGGPLLSSK